LNARIVKEPRVCK